MGHWTPTGVDSRVYDDDNDDFYVKFLHLHYYLFAFYSPEVNDNEVGLCITSRKTQINNLLRFVSLTNKRRLYTLRLCVRVCE